MKDLSKKLKKTVRSLSKKMKEYEEEAPGRRKAEIKRLEDEINIEAKKAKLRKIKENGRSTRIW